MWNSEPTEWLKKCHKMHKREETTMYFSKGFIINGNNYTGSRLKIQVVL